MAARDDFDRASELLIDALQSGNDELRLKAAELILRADREFIDEMDDETRAEYFAQVDQWLEAHGPTCNDGLPLIPEGTYECKGECRYDARRTNPSGSNDV